MTTAPAACPATRSLAAGGGRRRSPPRRSAPRCLSPRVTVTGVSRSFHTRSRRVRNRVGGRDYHGRMGLSLVVGPAHAGKVALLLERYLDVLDRDPGSSFRTVLTSSASSATFCDAGPRCLPGVSARSTISSSRSSAGDPSGVPSRAMRSGRSRRGGRSRRRRSTTSPRRRPRADSPTCCWRRSGSSNRRWSIPRPSEVISAVWPAGTAASSDRLGLWDRDGLRRRAAERIQADLGRLGRRARLRVRLRRPDGCGVGADRGARRADGRHRLDPVRAGARGVRRARGHGRRPRSAGGGRGRGAAACRAQAGPGRLGPSRARALRRRAGPGGVSRGLDRSSSKAPARAAPSSSSRAELLELSRNGTPPERIGIVCESPDRWRATFESVLGALGIPYSNRAPLAAGRDAARSRLRSRSSATGGSRGGAASSSRSCARRSPGSSGARWTSSRAACAGGRSWIPLASRRRARSCAARTFRRSSSCALSRIRSPQRRVVAADDGPKRVGTRRTARRGRRAWRCTRVPGCGAHARRARDVRARSTSAVSAPRTSIAALERTMVRPAAAAETGTRRRSRLRPRPHEDLRRRLPARAGGGKPPSPRPAVAAARRRSPARARRPARAAEHGCARSLPLLHGLHAGNEQARSRSRGGHRRRRSARAEPVLGRRPRALRAAPRSRAQRVGVRCRA